MVKKAENITRQAKIAIEKWREYFKYNIDQYHQMHQFVLGRQWEEEEEDMLTKTLNKVPLQFNKLATLVNTLLGEQQQNTPQIEVAPLSNCSEETAQIRELVVKDLMMSTDAKTVYQVAAAQAFIGGFGAYIVDTDYAADKSFDQKIIYRHVKDATKCYWDIGAEHVNKIDSMRCGYISRMTRKKFRQIYGKDVEEKILKESSITQSEAEIALATQPDSSEDPFNWANEDGVTIIDDYLRKLKKDTLYKLSNGREVNQDELDEIIERSTERNMQMREQQLLLQSSPGIEGYLPEEMEMEEEIEALYDGQEPVRIVDSKPYKRSTIMHRKMAGDYILEESEYPADDPGVIFVDQNSFYDKNGKQVCRPFVIDAVDAQRYLNYLGTQSAYILKISRYDQFIGSKKNAQGLDTQQQWKDPTNIKGMLYYDESPSGAKPEQLRPPELSASLQQQYQRAVDDMYTSTGLFPARMGQESNEVSGKAIDSRARQGSYSTYVAFNSINRAITAGGIIVNQMIPRVYDSERVISLITPDEGRKTITINQQMDEYGENVKNDIRKGEFEVRLQAGPSYEGQKAQALESLNMVLQANPSLLNIFADLYAENLPLVNTIEIKNRLKTIVPPQILEAGKTGKMPQEAQRVNPQEMAAQAEAQYKQQQIELKKQEIQIKMKEQEIKTQTTMMELEMKRLELMTELEEQKLRYLAETDRTHSDNAIAHADNITKLLTHTTKGKMDGNANKQYR